MKKIKAKITKDKKGFLSVRSGANAKAWKRNNAFAPPSLRYGVATAAAVVVVSVLIICAIAKAGNITPPIGAPSAKFYTLSEIYNFITSSATAIEGGHSFTFSDALSSTHRTLTEIYDSLKNLISADKVKLGTTYLNVAGTLTPDGGTAGVADLFSDKRAHLTNDWNLDTGTLNLACNTLTYDGTGNLAADGYDGVGIGNNRWCMTDSGDAAAGEMKTGKIAWVDGIAITGSGTQTLSADNQTVAAGYYEATTLSAVDSDLAVGNIRSGVDIFGVSGSLITKPLFGDDIASNVLTTAANPGTYDAATCGTVYNTSNLSAGNIKNGTAFGVGLTGEYPSASYPLPGNTDANAAAGNILTGYEAWDKAGTHISGAMVDRAAASYTPSNIAQTIAAGYYNGSGTVATDANLITGNILSGKIIFGVSGKTEVADTTEAAAPIAANMVLANKVGFVNGSKITGSLATRTLSADNQTVTAGYYEATTLSAVDSDLAVGNIRSGVNIFGVAGNFNVVDTSTGDATASEILSGYKAWVDGAEITGNASSGYSGWSAQKNVRWDDWRYGAGTTGSPFDEYTGEESTWTQTDAGGDAAKSVTDNAVTVSLSSNEVWQDTRTGLYWSNRTASTIDNEFRYDATGQCNFTDTGAANSYCDNQDPTSAYTEDNDVSANDFCLNLQLDANNDSVLETDWRLPSQKELMQAYIDGSANHLPNPDNTFWSATEDSGNAAYAWYVNLSYGPTTNYTKSNNRYARCVRP